MLTFLSARHAAFLDDLNRIQSRAERAQRQLSTGLRMNTISDQPDRVLSVRLRRAALLRSSFLPAAAEPTFGRFSTAARSPIC